MSTVVSDSRVDALAQSSAETLVRPRPDKSAFLTMFMLILLLLSLLVLLMLLPLLPLQPGPPAA